MLKFVAILALATVALARPAEISPTLRATLSHNSGVNVMVDFVGGNMAVLNRVEVLSFASRSSRLTFLKDSLKTHAQQSQAAVLQFLNGKNLKHKSFWISNQVYIKNADLALVEQIAQLPQVAKVYEENVVPKPILKVTNKQAREDPTPLAEWGIERVQAEAAWRITNGSGVVVANIDGGVHWTHEALVNQYRADHGWFDPADGTQNPWDEEDGHGTHTMGSICGTHGIGVAPGATWIACKGCGLVSCPQSDLTACGEFMLCPTNYDGSGEDCSKAPALVSNSWGGGGGSTWYEAITESWVTGGIVPIFSIGNSGSRCGSAGSPGDFRRVIGVGATNVRNQIASFSSRGPAVNDGRMKPELSGPGENIRSSMPGSSNNVYGTMSGTSMSCPHAAGVTALLLSLRPNLSFGEARTALLEGCDHNITAQGETCGNLRDDEFPSNTFGWGIINALQVVENANRTMNRA